MSWGGIIPASILIDEKEISYYVYWHINPITGRIFYIGLGTGKRAFDRSGRGRAWKKVVSELKAQGLVPSIVIVDNYPSRKDAAKREKKEIRRALKMGYSLTNIIGFKNFTENDNETYALIGDIFRNERIELGMTQKEVGKIASLTQQRVASIEAGTRNFRFGTAIKMAKALKLEINFSRGKRNG